MRPNPEGTAELRSDREIVKKVKSAPALPKGVVRGSDFTVFGARENGLSRSLKRRFNYCFDPLRSRSIESLRNHSFG
jgi:hypothetical protein